MIHREIEKEVLPYCQSEDITVLAWAPLGEGALTGKYSKEKTPKDSVRERHYFFRPENIEAINGIVKLLEETGRPHGMSAVQVALGWLTAKDRVVPIPGAKTAKQAEENLGGGGWVLTRDELSRLNDAADSLTLRSF